MPTQILAPTYAANSSSDVTITAGSTKTVAMYQGTSTDNLKLPGGIDNFLLPDGVSHLMLVPQPSRVLS
jgi:hypothetical protein